MGASRDEFQREMRALIDKYIGQSSTYEDYIDVASALEALDLEAEKFPDEDIDRAGEADADPIFAMIERNRELSAQYDAAASISGKLKEGPEFDAADAMSGETHLALRAHAKVLVQSKPTTIAGMIALSRYVGDLREWQVPDDERWPQIFLGMLADTMTEISAN